MDTEMITTITVTGMTCEHCVRAVREELTKLEAVDDVDVDLSSGRVTLRSHASVADSEVRGAVQEAGYEVAT